MDSPYKPLRQVQQRYCALALTWTVAFSVVFFLLGYRPLGKGLLLGAVFSILNFILMAATLPLRVGTSRNKSTLVALGSIAVRYALLAIPLVWAIKHEQFAVTTTAAGLFMIQFAILSDHMWGRLRTRRYNPVEGKS